MEEQPSSSRGGFSSGGGMSQICGASLGGLPQQQQQQQQQAGGGLPFNNLGFATQQQQQQQQQQQSNSLQHLMTSGIQVPQHIPPNLAAAMSDPILQFQMGAGGAQTLFPGSMPMMTHNAGGAFDIAHAHGAQSPDGMASLGPGGGRGRGGGESSQDGTPFDGTPFQVQSASVAELALPVDASAAAAAPPPGKPGRKKKGTTEHLSAEEKAKLHRDRNREHARSTRLRKKAYVNKLKDLVEGLRMERSEETKRRRVAVQHLAEVQRVRRAVVTTFLKFHASYESDPRRWATILEEDSFAFKQPVTPYRCFRRGEIEKECRVSRSIDAVIADSASIAVMVESIGSRSPRWMQIKREEFLSKQDAKTGTASDRRIMPHSIVRQSSRTQQTLSSISCSSRSSSGLGSGGEEYATRDQSSPRHGKTTDAARGKARDGEIDTIKGGHIPKDAKKISSASSSNSNQQSSLQSSSSNDFHHYNAPDLPDPRLDSGEGSSGSESPTGSATGSDVAVMPPKRLRRSTSKNNVVCTDSSSGDDNGAKPSASKKSRPNDDPLGLGEASGNISSSLTGSSVSFTVQSAAHFRGTTTNESSSNALAVRSDESGTTDIIGSNASGPEAQFDRSSSSFLPNPSKFAKSGGIAHSIRPIATIGHANARLSTAPAIQLPPFTGLGKKAQVPIPVAAAAGTTLHKPQRGNARATTESNSITRDSNFASAAVSTSASASGKMPSALSAIKSVVQPIISPPTIDFRDKNGNLSSRTEVGAYEVVADAGVAVIGDNDTSSSTSNQSVQIQTVYHVNEDDMLLTDSVLMCPFVFRSQDAVMCGALAECVMPGMLRAQFSQRNKLVSFELVYDAMGFMQQLERASGSEGSAQIIPNSLEMALSPKSDESRVITLAKTPYPIVSVNDSWSQTTKYSQMEVEGKTLSILDGKGSDSEVGKKSGKPTHDLAEVAKGRCACSVNRHYDRYGREFVDFVSSYPLTNANDEITHILHVCRELPVPITPPDIGSVSFENKQ